ncbi:MAG: DUF2062 domain-containing protein, partial [Candidatus Firestonebacteria bacterium]
MKKITKKKFNIKRILQFLYLKVIRLNDTPHKIALGVAIGVFIAVFPTFGLGFIFSVFFAWLLSANKAAALIGTLVGNPLFTPLFWGGSVFLGALLLDVDSATMFNLVKTGMYKDAS